ncbi:putative thylakoid lumenal 19 kDa protein, chloroplastic [Iris pallida]|uniref:Thylakoid lumenal 19 kDa protein, chloroplastic n=1 Tax=Iris pallida TaxID=29817 RepID=A0AAX6FY67_IRIPA|nr:putative thylakoid lumenal 19 kDa protein, chloroplastic [Iris pallida]
MATTTLFSSSSSLLSPSPSSSSSLPLPPKPQLLKLPKALPLAAAAAAAAALLLSTAPPSLAAEPKYPLHLYKGTTASAANYGGYGGNASKKDAAEYTYLVPDTWKEHLVSKVEKGTNGTDSEFYNPKKRAEKEYLTFLSGFCALAPRDAVLSNLALSDVQLQDLIASAAEVGGVRSDEARDGKGQLYYLYEIDGTGAYSLIKVTYARNKLYAHFVNAPNVDWGKDEEMLRTLHDSFRTVDDVQAGDAVASSSS